MRLRPIVKSLHENAHRYGASAALRDLGCRAVNKFADFRILRAMAARLPDVGDASFFDARGFDARFAGANELARFAVAGEHDLTVDFLREARARGDRCYALFDADALAAYGWYSHRPTPIDAHFTLHFDPAYIYMYKGFTVPAYRGKRLHAVGMCRALRAFSEEGRAGLVSWVDANNFASLQSVARMGYRIFGDVYLLRSGSLTFTRASRGCRDYRFWVEAAGASAHSFVPST